MRLRATNHDGGTAITRMLATVNLSDLATATGTRKARLVELSTGADKVKPATTEELISLCSVISGGLLRYIIDGDAIVTDAFMAIRMALIDRDVARIANDTAIPSDFLERYSGGADVLSADDLDVLAALLFDNRMRIDRVTGELVSVGYVAPPTVAGRRRRPLAFPTQPTENYHLNREITLDPKGLAPVAKGSEIPAMPTLKSEPPRAGWARLQAAFTSVERGEPVGKR